MLLSFTMDNPQQVIMRELTDPACRCITQPSVAITYAYLMAQEGDAADWPTVNAAIVARWSRTGLTRVKEMAWKHLEAWAKHGMPDQALEGMRG